MFKCGAYGSAPSKLAETAVNGGRKAPEATMDEDWANIRNCLSLINEIALGCWLRVISPSMWAAPTGSSGIEKPWRGVVRGNKFAYFLPAFAYPISAI